MPATTSYQAGSEANNVQLSYGVESVWGTVPATTFQAIRFTSETLASTKTRNRPQEVATTREMAAAVTVQVSGGGGVNFALSYGTYDDMLSALLGNDWGAVQTLAGIAGDVSITNLTGTTATLASTLGTKFSGIALGQWIRTLGFTNATNNDIWRVTARASNSSMTLTKATAGAPVTETPAGTAAQVRAQTIANGTQFKSLFFQKKLGASLWLNYPGVYPSDCTLSGGVGQFLNGAFTLLAQQELSAVADASTGGVLAAPAGRVHDPVGGFVGVFQNEAKLAATVDTFSLKIANTGAALEFGMGSAAAAGVLMGTLEVTGSMKLYFKDFTLYARYLAETQGALEFITKDATGNAYVITLPAATLMNPQIVAGGVGQAVFATFQIEGNPQATGGTIQIDKLPNS
jgi:hypothetical protein